jgi:hypothetical protein
MSLAARILVLLVAAVILAFVLRLVGQRKLRSKYALLWLVLGLVMLPIAAFPGISDRVADWLGIESTPALLLMMASAVLLLIVIHYSWELSRLEVRSRRLAEEVALLGSRLDEALGPERTHGQSGEQASADEQGPAGERGSEHDGDG